MIQLKNSEGVLLYEADADDVKSAVEEAIRKRISLIRVDLQYADLQNAELRGADLQGADLRGADLQNAKLPPFSVCPEKGAFVGFKKLRDDRIAELEIPTDAARTSSLVGRKCRAAYVRVLAITSIDGRISFENGCSLQLAGSYIPGVVYEVGKETRPDGYNDDIRVECAQGIHFFITRQEAIDC